MRPDHAKGSERIPTIPPDDEVLELDDNVRKTEKMSASHFRSLMGPTAMLAHMPSIPPPRDTLTPPIEHEEVASSGLMAAALAQIKAGAKIRLKSETDAPETGVDLEEAIDSRRAPSTLPISNKRLAEITATADARPAVAMAPLARPAEGTPAPADLLAAKKAGEERGEHLESPDERRPMQRMQRLKRFESEEPVEAPPRSDTKLIVAACIVIVASVATIIMVLTP